MNAARLTPISALLVACALAPACETPAPPSSPPPAPAAPADPAPAPVERLERLVLGFVYDGPRADGGFNQSHAVVAAALAKVPGLRILEKEHVSDGPPAAAAFERLVSQGASIVFPTAPGHFSQAVKA